MESGTAPSSYGRFLMSFFRHFVRIHSWKLEIRAGDGQREAGQVRNPASPQPGDSMGIFIRIKKPPRRRSSDKRSSCCQGTLEDKDRVLATDLEKIGIAPLMEDEAGRGTALGRRRSFGVTSTPEGIDSEGRLWAPLLDTRVYPRLGLWRHAGLLSQ